MRSAWIAEPYAVVAVDIPHRLGGQVFTNFGDDLSNGTKAWFANFGLYGPIKRFTLTLELNLTESRDNYITPGVIWRPHTGLEIGVGAPVGLAGTSDRYRIILSVIQEFERN